MKTFIAKVFGSTWGINIATIQEKPLLESMLGYTDRSINSIFIRDLQKNPLGDGLECPENIMVSTLRHELTHAALFECGLMDTREYTHEQIADWVGKKLHPFCALVDDCETKMLLMMCEDS